MVNTTDIYHKYNNYLRKLPHRSWQAFKDFQAESFASHSTSGKQAGKAGRLASIHLREITTRRDRFLLGHPFTAPDRSPAMK
jgi:hypothetical protein